MKISHHEDNDDEDKYSLGHPSEPSTDGVIQRQEAMINDLIQLTRLQNNEINSLRQEVRRLSASATATEDELRGELSELKRQIAALRDEQQQQQQQQQKERKGRKSSSFGVGSLGSGGDTTPPSLTRKPHVAIRDSQTVKDRIIAAVKEDVSVELGQKQDTSMHAVKTQVRDLEKLMGSVLAGVGYLYTSLVPPSETRDEVSSFQHCYYDLEQEVLSLMQNVKVDGITSEVSRITTQQILLHYQFSSLAETLTRCVATKPDENNMPAADMHRQLIKLSESVDRQLRVINNHNQLVSSHTEDIGKIQTCLFSMRSVLEMFEETKHESDTLKTQLRELEHKVMSSINSPPHSPPWSSSDKSATVTPHNENNGCVEKTTELSTALQSHEQTLQQLAQRVDLVEQVQKKHKNSLFSNSRDVHNLQKRLNYAETMIGGLYRPGDISVKGRSFYLDAVALRYMPSTRSTFTKFYGNRAEVARFVDIAPRVVLLAFHAISRVRCSHEIWEDNLELKQGIRRVAEDIIDMWVAVLPLREGDEHLACPDRTFVGAGNHLKLLCRRANLNLDSQ